MSLVLNTESLFNSTRPEKSFQHELLKFGNLDVHFLEWEISFVGGEFNPRDPYFYTADEYGRRISRPRWHVIQRDLQHPDRWWHLFEIQNDDGTFRPPDMRTIKKLNEDLLWALKREGVDPGKAGEMVHKAIQLHREEYLKRERKRLEDDKKDFFAANKRKLEEVFDNIGKEGPGELRDAKSFSYVGQGSRTSSGERDYICAEPEEAGWELPDSYKEND